MENDEVYQKRIGIAQSNEQVPDTLLSNVQTRLKQRQRYLQGNLSPQDMVAGLTHPAWEIRTAALQALDGSITTDIRPFLLAALEDEHRLVRVAALRALSRLEKEASLEYLLQALSDNEWEVREMAVLSLSELNMQETDFVGALLRVAQHDPYITVRDAAQCALDKHENDLAASSDKYSREAVTLQSVRENIPLSSQKRAQQTMNSAIHYGVILKKQLALIHKSVWFGALSIMLLGSALSLEGMFNVKTSAGILPPAISYLVLSMCVSAAAGTAFLYGGEHDLALELTLATPTSIRLIMLFRFILVLGYNVLLSACASIVIAVLHGGGIWEVIQTWLGPMVMIASITFAISLLLGSWFSLLISLITTFMHLLSFNTDQSFFNINLIATDRWQIQPMMFVGVLILLIIAVYYAPRQPRLGTI